MGEFLLDYDVVRAAADPAHMTWRSPKAPTRRAPNRCEDWARTLLERRPPN